MISAPGGTENMTGFEGLKTATPQELVTIQRLLKRLGYLKMDTMSRELDEATVGALATHFSNAKEPPGIMATEQVIRSLFSEAWTKEGWASGSVAGQNLVVDKTEVHGAQVVLQKLGYAPGPVDGVFGPATLSAVESFQEDNGLRVRGLLTRTCSKISCAPLSSRTESPIPPSTC